MTNRHNCFADDIAHKTDIKNYQCCFYKTNDP